MNFSIEEAISGAKGKAAGIFPADLSRVILSASKADYDLIRWAKGPNSDVFIRDLHILGEKLIILD